MDERALVRCLTAIGQAVLSHTPLAIALDEILASVRTVLPQSDTSIMLVQDDELFTFATNGLLDTEEQIRFRLGDGLAGWCATKGESVCLNNPGDDGRFTISADQAYEISAIMSVPLHLMGSTAGVLNVHTSKRKYSELDFETAELIASLICASLQRHRLEQIAKTDALTGLGNRRHFDDVLNKEGHRMRRYGNDLALLVFDLDGMKTVNDQLGHPAGDGLLRDVGRRVQDQLRGSDSACRIGGDEFAAVLPDTNIEAALHIAERFRSSVGEWAAPVQGIGVTASFGVVACDRDSPPERWIARADKYLYAAKSAGRNRVMGDGSIGQPM